MENSTNQSKRTSLRLQSKSNSQKPKDRLQSLASSMDRAIPESTPQRQPPSFDLLNPEGFLNLLNQAQAGNTPAKESEPATNPDHEMSDDSIASHVDVVETPVRKQSIPNKSILKNRDKRSSEDKNPDKKYGDAQITKDEIVNLLMLITTKLDTVLATQAKHSNLLDSLEKRTNHIQNSIGTIIHKIGSNQPTVQPPIVPSHVNPITPSQTPKQQFAGPSQQPPKRLARLPGSMM